MLHIEDDPGNRLLVRKLLQAAGHEVIDAADGLEGVRLAFAERPDSCSSTSTSPGSTASRSRFACAARPSLNGVPDRRDHRRGRSRHELRRRLRRLPPEAHRRAQLRRACRAATSAGTRERCRPPGRARASACAQQSQRIVAHLEEKVAELSRRTSACARSTPPAPSSTATSRTSSRRR